MQEKIVDSPLYLVGYGGLAREVYGWLVHENSVLLERFAGFLITDGNKVDSLIHGFPVKHVDDIQGTFSYLLTVGSPAIKDKIYNELSIIRGATLESFISADTAIGVNVSIGQGAIVNPRSSISSDVRIGKLALINCNTGIGHDVVIGDNCSVLGSASINGDVTIGNNVLIGCGAIIHPGKKVGDDAVVGMGSVVFRNVKARTTVIGNPAKVF
jgi:sugar O-acyltransferase (sialic acid O-acetyltransferase NeuD family)